MSKEGPITPASGPMTPPQQALFALILLHLPDGVVILDADGRIEWINPAAERLFGWPLCDVLGRRPVDLVGASPPAGEPKGVRLNRLILARHRRRDGSSFWNQYGITRIAAGRGPRDRRTIVTCRDVSAQVAAEAEAHRMRDQLEHAAHHDDLTGLANRKKLAEFLGSALIRRRIARGEIGVLQLDIDLFKDINDTMGHAAGDALLRHVAEAMRATAGPADLSCRTGGDEFVQICAGTRTREALVARGEALRAAIARPMRWEATSIRVGTSIGASLPAGPHTTGEALIQMADQALYTAKRRGRGRVVLYTERMGRLQLAETHAAHDLRRALQERQFLVHLQPQLDLRQNRITGVEALLRWGHPARGLLLPADFLRTAESQGLLAEIDYLSMKLSLDALVALRKAGFGDLTLALNMSASILADVNYPALLNWALQSRGIAARDISVEILETSLLDRRGPDLRSTIRALKRMGVRVALDDFGIGHAGLGHMAALEIDAIKLDCSLTARLHCDPRSRAVALAMLGLSVDLGMDMIAEGVETDEQFEILRAAGCPVIQGFWLAYPMRPPDMIHWLRDQSDAPRSGPAQDRAQGQVQPG